MVLSGVRGMKQRQTGKRQDDVTLVTDTDHLPKRYLLRSEERQR